MRRKKAKVDGPGQRRNSGGRPRKRPLLTEEERVEEEAGEELERALEQLLDDEDVSGMFDASSAVGLIPAAPPSHLLRPPRAEARGGHGRRGGGPDLATAPATPKRVTPA